MRWFATPRGDNGRLFLLSLGINNNDVSMHPDGKRFIMISSGDADAETPDSFEIHVVQNFFEILKARASTKY